MTKLKLEQEIQATAEIYGRQMSRMSAIMFLQDLSGYGEDAISKALARCRMELRTFPTIADILSRIDDGRPTADEAWAMIPRDESSSVVWTAEIASAYGTVYSLIDEDRQAARLAFRDKYLSLVAESRRKRIAPKWLVSLGFDRDQRLSAIRNAVDRGRLTIEAAREYVPEIEYQGQLAILEDRRAMVRRLLPDNKINK